MTICVQRSKWLWTFFFLFLVVWVLVLLPGEGKNVCHAAEQILDGTVENEPIYGAALMDDSEIDTFRRRIRECRTPSERQEFRNRNRMKIQKRMQQRNRTAGEESLQEGAGAGDGSRAMGSNTTFQKRRSGSGGGGGEWKKGGK